MNLQTTYYTLILWLNSCVTDEQINLVLEAGERFLVERFDAKKEFTDLQLAAEDKKNLPAQIIEPPVATM